MFVNRVNDPVDSWVVADLRVSRINENDFVVFHGRILVNPVGVQDPQVGVNSSNLFFSNALKIAFKLELVDTLMLGLTPHHTTVVLTLASSTTDSDANDNISLLRLVSETMRLFSSGRSVASSHLGALTVLPGTDAHQESESIRLLVAPQLGHVLVSRHVEVASVRWTVNEPSNENVRKLGCFDLVFAPL